MDDLLAARLQMAVSLGFHIIFACIGMTMPVLMAFSEWRWLRTGKQVFLDVTKAWSKGVAIFFAVGAVSGTVLSFELGLLWPQFMQHAGPIIGMPFSWEGTALLQPLSGDFSAKDIAVRQPAKLAAMEALYKTSKPAPLVIGGIPNEKEERVDYAIHIPKFLSYLAHGDFNAEVTGLDKFPKDERPPVIITHIAFQVMVGC